MGQGWEDLLWPPKWNLGCLPGKPSLLLLLSLSLPCPSPPASHISASELLAPPRAAAAAPPLLLLLRPLHQQMLTPQVLAVVHSPKWAAGAQGLNGMREEKAIPKPAPLL